MATTQEGKDFIKNLDFDSAVACFTEIIDQLPPPPPGGGAATPATGEDYLYRGYALCFVDGEKNLEKALSDCSAGISRAIANSIEQLHAYRIRAFVYYLKGDFANALTDCTRVIKTKNPSGKKQLANNEDILFAQELQPKIHLEMANYEKAADEYRILLQGNPNAPLSTIEEYREAVRKMKHEW
jgi:tetratricopeptide (TPR) repeat protein